MRAVYVGMVLASAGAFAQSSAKPTFEVASVRESKGGRQSVEVQPGSLIMRSYRLGAAIGWAFELPDPQISGPGWMNDVAFDIVAKAGPDAKEPELRQMLQTLLAERFKLEFHRQTKETNALVLTVAKGGHKLKPVEQEGNPSFSTGKLNLTGKGATIGQLTTFLSKEVRVPVIDQTGLTGRFDYFLDINAYVTEEMTKSQGPPIEAPSIIAQAIKAQLGLQVDPKKVPLEMLIVDKLEKTPTEN